jgi:hypothetical protein
MRYLSPASHAGVNGWAQLFSGLGWANSASFAVSPDSSTVFVLGASSPSMSVPPSFATVLLPRGVWRGEPGEPGNHDHRQLPDQSSASQDYFTVAYSG